MTGAVGAALSIGGKLLDKLFPDPVEKAKAQAVLMDLEQRGELADINAQMQMIVSEAKSDDPWTSRARPSFLYVMYVMILSALPMGALFAFYPETAAAVTTGAKDWLAAIPDAMWTLFGAGYLGYVGARSVDKRKKL